MALPAQFGGILPPVCTPLTESCDVDDASLRRLLDFHLTAGVHGIFLLGTSSETTLLSDRQRATVIETGISAVGGRVPVIVGVLDTATAAVIDQARTAQGLGADAIVVTAPFYVSANQAEILEHFRRVRSAVDLPILAYDIPVTVHSKLTKETVLTLAREGTIVGIKDSSGDEGNLRSLVVEGRDMPAFSVFTGAERTADLSLSYDASGVVPGLGNVDPSGFVRLYTAAMAGDWEKARAEQDRIMRLFPLIYSGDLGRMSMFSSI
jgi:4-hydroxy-tetrahydrodipicolinate synthase